MPTLPVFTRRRAEKSRKLRNHDAGIYRSEPVQLNLTSRSGRAAVKHRMEEMGYKDTDYNMDHLYDAFLKLADKKGGYLTMTRKH